jgi:hypothetical protein
MAVFSAGYCELAGRQAGCMLTDHLLSALTAAAAVGTNAQLLTDLGITVALLDSLLNLLLGNGFAQTYVHGNQIRMRITLICNLILMRRICNSLIRYFLSTS